MTRIAKAAYYPQVPSAYTRRGITVHAYNVVAGLTHCGRAIVQPVRSSPASWITCRACWRTLDRMDILGVRKGHAEGGVHGTPIY